MNYKDFIITCLEETSKVARDNFGKVTSTTKPGDNNQVLTETDIAIANVLVDRIKKEFPQHNIIDEETGVVDNKSNFTWVLDPIDGTSNFAAGIHMYGIMMGLLEGGTPIAGGIALPSFDELYYAIKSEGAFCNGTKIKVTNETELSSVLISYGIDSHKDDPDFTKKECETLEKIISNCRNIRISNSCYDLAMVARGSYGAKLNKSMRIWDNIAEHILIEEAGGKVTGFFGESLNYENTLTRSKEHFTMCAASPILHEDLQKIIKEEV